MPRGKGDIAIIDGPFHGRFREMAKEIDANNEKRERLIRASRDVTAASKKAIFELHRINAGNKKNVVRRASQAIERVCKDIAKRIAVELDAGSQTCFRRFYSPGMQEFVEAREMLEYIESGKLAGITRIQEELTKECHEAGHGFVVHLEEADYLLGVADLTGECMRLAVQGGGKGEITQLEDIREFVNEIWVRLSGLEGLKWFMGKEYDFKMRVMRSSLEKVEKSFYEVKVRRAEFGGLAETGEKKRKIC